MDVQTAMAHRFEPTPFSYTDRDVMLYALAIGFNQTLSSYLIVIV